METSLPSTQHEWPWLSKRGDLTPIHSFIGKENTSFLREKQLKIRDHLCGWLKLKEKPEFSKNKQEFNNRRAIHVKKREVLAWKHDVSFNRLGADFCILLYYNYKQKWACFLVFNFLFLLKLVYTAGLEIKKNPQVVFWRPTVETLSPDHRQPNRTMFGFGLQRSLNLVGIY